MLDMKIEKSLSFFIETDPVKDYMLPRQVKALRKFGGTVRKIARRSIRQRKKASAPGSPPSSHVGTLKNFLFFVVDQETESVVIGPALTNQVSVGESGAKSGVGPAVLEFGGRIGIIEVLKWGKWRRADLRSRRRNADLPTRLRFVEIAARPYMGPAFDKALPDAAGYLADAA